MSKYALIVAALSVIVAGTHFPGGQQGQTSRQPRQSRTTFLEGHLLKLGEEYDVYFTLEAAWEEGESSNWMEIQKIKEAPQHDGLQRELERLVNSVPHFTYTFDRTNPRVIHVADARLARQNEYGLDSVIQSIDYRGNPAGLVTALGARGIKVSAEILMTIGDPRPRDYDTEVRVAGRNISVRDAITHFTPLEGRRRILWVSTTKLAPGAVSQIDFFAGPKKSQ